MRKLIGTIVILLVLYAGFFGINRFNIKPFIMNWIKSDDGKETIENVVTTTTELAGDAVDSIKAHIIDK